MAQALGELKKHAQEQISSIRTYTAQATEDLHDLVTSERGHLRSLDKLGKLDELDKLVSAIGAMKDDNHMVSSALEKKIECLAHAVVDNTKAQRGESGIPFWLKICGMVLFAATCILVIAASVMYIKENPRPDNVQAAMYSDTTNAADTVAADTMAEPAFPAQVIDSTAVH